MISAPISVGPPRLPLRLVPRDALLRRLDRLAPITIVESLSGHGKTTLVAMWAQRRRHQRNRVVWLHASADLNSLSTFLAGLHACLCRAGLAEAATVDLDPQRLWTRITGALATSQNVPTIVVIDDMHHLDDPEILDTLCMMLGQYSHTHLVACVQIPHPLLTTARSNHLEVNTVTGSDLTISAEEVALYADTWGHQVDEKKARHLHELVGGWLLPMRLVLDANPASSQTFATDVAREFFEHEVMPQVLDVNATQAAMRLALSTSVTEASARAALTSMSCTPNTDTSIVTWLQRIGVLRRLPQQGTPEWRFPTLVRHTLVEAFESQHPEEAGRCHGMLALSLEESGGPLGAVLRHARRGADWALLARLWAEHGLQLTVDFPDDAAFAYTNVPEPALAVKPALMIPASIVGSLMARPDDAERGAMMRKFMQVGKFPLEKSSTFSSVSELGSAVVAAMITWRAEGDLSRSRGLAVRFKAELDRPTNSPAVSTGLIAWFYLQWGMTEFLAGDLEQALTLSTTSFDVADGGKTDFIASNAAANIALIHAMNGATADARRWLEIHEEFDDGDRWMHHLVTLPARIAQALLELDRLDGRAAEAELDAMGDGASGVELWPFIAAVATRHALLFGNPVGMLEHLEHLENIHSGHVGNNGAARRILDRCRADLLLSLGEAHRAQQLLRDSSASLTWLQTPTARLHLMTGDPARARNIAAATVWDKTTSVRERIDLLMIQAAAALEMEDEDEARIVLAQAEGLARYAGIEGSSLLVPLSLTERLGHPSPASSPPAEGDEDHRPRRPFPEAAELIVLSAREQTVLHLLHQHDSLADVAKALTVSVNTVKKQTVSIYAKLGVHQREAALLRARRLGLINAPLS